MTTGGLWEKDLDFLRWEEGQWPTQMTFKVERLEGEKTLSDPPCGNSGGLIVGKIVDVLW
jgi:hypothetical protein